MTVDVSGNVYVAGNTAGTLPGQSNAGNGDPFVRKYSSSGTEVWTWQFGTEWDDRASSVAIDGSGNLYVAGETGGQLPGHVSMGGYDAFVVRFTP